MILNRISIKRRLFGAFTIVFVLTLAIAGMVFWKSAQLWSSTKRLYDHPYVVSNSIRDIRANVYAMNRSMALLLESTSEEQFLSGSKSIARLEKEIEEDFELIKDRYLGDKKDIDTSYLSYLESGLIRQEVMHMIVQDKREEARRFMNQVGVKQMERVLENLLILEKFAKNKADDFYTDAKSGYHSNIILLIGFLGFLLLIVLIIAFFLLRSINKPLIHLHSVANRIQSGHWDEKVKPTGRDELAFLGVAINNMLDSLNLRTQVEENQRKFGNRLLNSQNLDEFSRGLIQELVRILGAPVAAFYSVNEAEDQLSCSYSLGLNREKLPVFSPDQLDGGYAHSWLSGKIETVLQKASLENFVYKTILGEILPEELITVPILYQDHILCMVIIGKNGSLTSEERTFLEAIRPMISAAYANLKREEEAGLLNQELNKKNAELSQQTEELQTQTEELQTQTEELKSQTEELSTQSEELLSVTQELQLRNQELEKLESELRHEKAKLDVSIIERTAELEKAKLQAEESDRLKTAFLANMSHEVRTPINAILGFSELLLDNSEDQQERDKYLHIINSSGELLFRLISDIVEIAKIESDQLSIESYIFSPDKLLKDVFQSYQANLNIRNKKISFELSLPKNSENNQLESDVHRIKQVLINLVNNAIKFTETGKVELGYRMDADRSCTFHVKDTGIGIKPEELDKIFGRFVQAEDNLNRRKEGTGLGLAISRGITEKLKGHIWVESVEGNGSTFFFKLPNLT